MKEITGATRLAGLFAKPSRHSISPLIHNTAFQNLGVDARYLAFDVGQETLPQAIEAIRTFHMLGANLSMPNKVAAVSYMDELSPTAQLVGAINTIVNKDGKLYGDSTDGTGFMWSLKEKKVDVFQNKMTILGTGGAALSIIAQAALDGVKEIAVYNRKSAGFNDSQKKLANFTERTNCVIHLNDLADPEKLAKDVAESVLLVNATSVGMHPHAHSSPIENYAMIQPKLFVYDAIYNPRETQLLKEARLRGAETSNGLDMLLYQGAVAFEQWTGQKMPVSVVKRKIENR